mgnify:CR=1 FL=1
MTTFAPATRTATKARIALSGPSGSGKTYTALALAHGLGQRVAVIDTERGSASKYAGDNGWTFDTVAPGSFSPDSLSSLLAAAAGEGYEVVVVDSLSHYWMGVDGMLEQADRLKHGSNSFSGWKEARPAERRMIDALIAYPGHVIVTMRTKTEYVIEEDARGKKVPRKVGLKPEQRDGIEYEFDLVGDLDLENTLVVSKTRISALNRAVVPEPGVELAKTIADWLGSGTAVEDASDLRSLVLADDVTLAELTEVGARMNSLGLRAAMVTDADGTPVQLAALLTSRWQQLNQAPVAAQGGE